MSTYVGLTNLYSNPCVLLPAYGATYSDMEAMHKAWCAGTDFRIKGGSYTSIRDLSLLRRKFSSLWLTNWDGKGMMVG